MLSRCTNSEFEERISDVNGCASRHLAMFPNDARTIHTSMRYFVCLFFRIKKAWLNFPCELFTSLTIPQNGGKTWETWVCVFCLWLIQHPSWWLIPTGGLTGFDGLKKTDNTCKYPGTGQNIVENLGIYEYQVWLGRRCGYILGVVRY